MWVEVVRHEVKKIEHALARYMVGHKVPDAWLKKVMVS
jgi:hypothetical protein